MKTDKLAARILLKIRNRDGIKMPGYTVAQITEAMQEYHKSQLKDELIKFIDFCMYCSTEIIQLSYDKFIDEYLKQRPWKQT